MATKLKLRSDQLSRLCVEAGITNTSQLAAAMGISLPTVLRVLDGTYGPGSVFIGSLWSAFPHVPLEDLFERVPG